MFFPNGKLLMKLLISTERMFRPSSARILTADIEVTQNSRPSPGIFGYIPNCNVSSRVDFPWKPPPQMSVMPFGIPIPFTVTPEFGRVKLIVNRDGDSNGTASLLAMGRSSAPLFVAEWPRFEQRRLCCGIPVALAAKPDLPPFLRVVSTDRRNARRNTSSVLS